MTVFLDTNILVYAHDADAGEKYRLADQWIQAFFAKGEMPAISIQVLQEFFTVMVRRGGSARLHRELVEHYLTCCPVMDNTRELMRRALEIQQRFQLSFWDANIVAAAQQAGAQELWTEDLNGGQLYDGVRVINPFET